MRQNQLFDLYAYYTVHFVKKKYRISNQAQLLTIYNESCHVKWSYRLKPTTLCLKLMFIKGLKLL